MAQGLRWVLPRCSSNLAVDLIVEVFCKGSFRVSISCVSGSRHKLLQLNSRDKVFVLGSHDAIPLGEEEDLMVPLCAPSILLEIRLSLLFRQLHKLLRMGNNGNRLRRL